ncbi:MerR family transcriptional regulator [Paenibacillus faecalis]|uniref:MerR family transcriptional regulator n=1 Tax=Paenibacillus faecalis TaxID=2079532 RepID=UPI000D0EA388|nr:MerR family transcriptional regulator [Paenibacillus faecalis]
MKAYSIKDLSSISGVSVQTLNYYEKMGLLSPSNVSSSGYRYYETEQLFRLQQVMFYRELDFSLAEIGTLMTQDQDRIRLLQTHKQRLIDKAICIQTLIHTIDYTLQELRNGNEVNMDHRRLYDGFDPIKQEQDDKAVNIERSEQTESFKDKRRDDLRTWSKKDYINTQKESDAIYIDLCKAMEDGKEPGSQAVQSIIQRHYDWVCHFYTPTKDIYSGLGDLYVDHGDFKKLYAGYHPRLAEYLRDGIKIFAEQKL